MTAQMQTIESLLGVTPPRNTSLGLSQSIRRGLPVSAIDRLAHVVAPQDAGFKFRLISKATLERRRNSASKRLTSEEGDRLARVAKVFSFALGIYKDPAKAREFLGKPHMMLDHETPLDVAVATNLGAEEVINLMGRMAYGGGV